MLRVYASRLRAVVSARKYNSKFLILPNIFQILLYAFLVVLCFVTLHSQLSQKRMISKLRYSINSYEKKLMSAGYQYFSEQLASFNDLHDTLSHEKESLGYRLDEDDIKVNMNVDQVTGQGDESNYACGQMSNDESYEWRCWQQSDTCKIDVDGPALNRNDRGYWVTQGSRMRVTDKYCEKWSSVSPDFYHYVNDDFCRNPDGRAAPWCYSRTDRIVSECYYTCGYEYMKASSIRLRLNHEVRMKLIIARNGDAVSITAASTRASFRCALGLNYYYFTPHYWHYYSRHDKGLHQSKDVLTNRNEWMERVIDARMKFRNGCLKEIQFNSVTEKNLTCIPGCKPLQFLTIRGTADVIDFEQVPLTE